jgi:4-aminobutyrate aminotransferase/(S)-3-amino-2-methylpropionate transaminase
MSRQETAPAAHSEMLPNWPGGENAARMEQRRKYVARGVYSATPIFAAHGKGAVLTDVDGQRYLDFAAGIGTLAVGYSHPTVVNAVTEQVQRFLHTCFSVAMYEPYVQLAKELAELAPGQFEKKAIFFNSGAEAVENAVKIARSATGRPAVVAFENSFHGRTLMTMSLTGKVHPYRDGFGPFAPEVYLSAYPYPYRFDGNSEACAVDAVDRLERLFATCVSSDRVAAIIFEPVQGEGGFVVPPVSFVQALRETCDRNGILLVADEIQTGFGRTGRMFAVEHFGVTPDLVVLAKSLAAGMPLSGVVGRSDVMDAPEPGSLGGTYSGNPVSCAAALAVLRVFRDEALIDRAVAIGNLARTRLTGWQDRFECIGDIRGLGPMLALELVETRSGKEPATKLVETILARCHRNGLVILKSGLFDNVIRLHIPLVTTDEQVSEGLSILENALAATHVTG